MSGIQIIGTGIHLPDFIASNEDYTKIVETSDEWITTRTGIKERRISTGEPTWVMGKQAAELALADAGVSAAEIDMLIVTTVTPDFFSPSTACVIQGALGACNAFAYDINCACAGFVYSLDLAKKYLDSGEVKTVLLVSCEELSKITNYADRSTCVLFGDGAAACVVRKSESMYASYLKSDGTGAGAVFARALSCKNPFLEIDTDQQKIDHFPDSHETDLYMNGQEVYKFATRAMPEAVCGACEKAGIVPGDLDVIMAHQANYRIVETAAKKLKIPLEKCYLNIDQYGNTSSASIPIGLHEIAASGRVKRGDKVCIVGFGAGLIYGASVFTW